MAGGQARGEPRHLVTLGIGKVASQHGTREFGVPREVEAHVKALQASHKRRSIAQSLCCLGPEQGHLVDAGRATTGHVYPHPGQGQGQHGLVGIGALSIPLPPRADELLGLTGMTVPAEQTGSEADGSGLPVVVAELGEQSLRLGADGLGGRVLSRVSRVADGPGEPAQQVGPSGRVGPRQVSRSLEVVRRISESRELIGPVSGSGQGNQSPLPEGLRLIGAGHRLGRREQVVGHDRESGGWRRVAQSRDCGQVGLAPVAAGEHPVGHLAHDVLGEGVPPELSGE